MKVIVINGYPRAGKDTFVYLCRQIGDYEVFNISIIDAVKEVATKCGWSIGDKTQKDRAFLCDLKNLWTEYNDGPYKSVERRIKFIKKIQEDWKVEDKTVIFVHAREPKDIKRLVEEFNAQTLFIERPGIDMIYDNDADANVEFWEYDYVIQNIDDLSSLKDSAETFMKNLMGEK